MAQKPRTLLGANNYELLGKILKAEGKDDNQLAYNEYLEESLEDITAPDAGDYMTELLNKKWPTTINPIKIS